MCKLHYLLSGTIHLCATFNLVTYNKFVLITSTSVKDVLAIE